METCLTRFGRRVHKLTQMLQDPKLFRLHRLGVGPETYTRYNRPWFHRLDIQTIFDVGANSGQFSRMMAAVRPNAKIHAMEPLPDCYEKLAGLAREGLQVTAHRTAVGARTGMIEMHRNVYPDSSSIRVMKDIHREQFPFTAGIDQALQAPITTLDEIGSRTSIVDNVFVKVDVQGYEDEVLRGGREIVSRAKAVVLEVSFVPLYEHAPTFDEIYSTMKSYGHTFAGCLDQLVGPLDGAILQGDALFLRA